VCSTEGHCNAASDRCTQPAGATNPKSRGGNTYIQTALEGKSVITFIQLSNL